MEQHQVDQYTHYMGPRRKRGKGEENLFKEIMSENYPSMGKQTSRSKMSQKLPEKVNLKRSKLKHTVIKSPKVKDKGLP